MSGQQQENDSSDKIDSSSKKLQTAVSWIVVAILIVFGAFSLMKLTSVHRTEGDYWQILIRDQFPVVVGLPMAGLGALFVTLVLRISTGPLEVELAGLKFKGAAAPIIFWILCFMSGAVALKMLWQANC